MFCSNCGKQITDDAAFCAYCGARQPGLKMDVSCVSSEAAVPGPSSAYKNSMAAVQADIAEDLRALENMMVLLIVSLVLWFLFPIAGLAVNVYLLFKSRDLLAQTKAVFESRGYTLYANDMDDIRRRCEFILNYMKYSLYYILAMVLFLVGVALLGFIARSDFGGGPLALVVMVFYTVFGLIGLCFFIVYFYAFYQSVYCFVRFFKIKGYVYRLGTGCSIESVPESSSTLALCVCFAYWILMILFFSLGILATFTNLLGR